MTSLNVLELNLAFARPVRRWYMILAFPILGEGISSKVLDPGHATNVRLELRPG